MMIVEDGASKLAGRFGLRTDALLEEARKSKWPRTGAGHINLSAAKTALAKRFPSIATGVPGIAPWEYRALIRWLVLDKPTDVARQAALFVLGIQSWCVDWDQTANEDTELLAEFRRRSGDPKATIALPRFDLFAALRVWDQAHVDAMFYWLEAPFWP